MHYNEVEAGSLIEMDYSLFLGVPSSLDLSPLIGSMWFIQADQDSSFKASIHIPTAVFVEWSLCFMESISLF